MMDHSVLHGKAGTAPDLAPLWQAMRSGADPVAREQIIHVHMRFARIMAGKLFAGRAYVQLEFADYLQYATVGLIEAVDRFDAERGIKFETFAASRISGAILDGVRASSDLQEQISARKRLLAGRLAALRDEAPEPKEAGALFARLAELAIGLAIGFALEGSGMYRREEGTYADNTYTGVELKQLRQRVVGMLDTLPGTQGQVIGWHYLQQLSFEEIAERLNVSRSRIAQVHKAALGNLRTRLESKAQTDVSC